MVFPVRLQEGNRRAGTAPNPSHRTAASTAGTMACSRAVTVEGVPSRPRTYFPALVHGRVLAAKPAMGASKAPTSSPPPPPRRRRAEGQATGPHGKGRECRRFAEKSTESQEIFGGFLRSFAITTRRIPSSGSRASSGSWPRGAAQRYRLGQRSAMGNGAPAGQRWTTSPHCGRVGGTWTPREGSSEPGEHHVRIVGLATTEAPRAGEAPRPPSRMYVGFVSDAATAHAALESHNTRFTRATHRRTNRSPYREPGPPWKAAYGNTPFNLAGQHWPKG